MRKIKLILLLALASPLMSCAPSAIMPSVRTPNAVYYLNPAQLDFAQFPAPPAAGSVEDKADFAALHEWQNKRTAEECARAKSEMNGTYEQFFGTLNPFPAPLPSDAEVFLKRIHKDSDAAVGILKARFQRPRPFLRDTSLSPCLPKPDGLAYPSGHTTAARLFALVLADLAPQRREEFLARADEAALDRVIAGVHHPSDIAMGKKLADMLYAQMRANPVFLADEANLRRCLAR